MATTEKKVKATKKETVAKEVKEKAVEATKAPATKTVKPTVKDYKVIIEPIITEKTMSQTQNENKATFKVLATSNKLEIKNAIQRIYGVKVVDIKTVNVIAKATTRGSKYHGMISGYKKAIVRIENGQAIDLFKE